MTGRVIAGRRPVFGPDLAVAGYRPVVAWSGAAGPGDQPGVLTGEMAGRHAGRRGWERLCGSKQVFVAPSRRFVAGHESLALPPHRTVLVADAAGASDPEAVEGYQRLAGEGYLLAVDGLDLFAADSPVLGLASFVFIDFLGLPSFGLRGLMELARSAGTRPVAVGVDDAAHMTLARHAGFELFEGHLLSRPLSAKPDALNPGRFTILRMIEAVNDPGTSATDLQKLVEADAGLSYRLLHVSSLGAAGGLRRPVRSVREATVLLGRERLYRWLVLMLVADANQGAPEQIGIAMSRARMAELVAVAGGAAPADAAFTVGLVSALELVLCAPLPDIVAKLAITNDLVQAVLGRRGPLGGILDDVLAWEAGDPPDRPRSGVDHLDLERLYVDAVGWAEDLIDILGDADRAA